MRSAVFAMLAVAACGVRAPAPIDVAALVAKRGPIEARRDLEIRVIADPRDVQARLALAQLAEHTLRPSEAIEELEAVEKLGGPIGTRWHDDDRARLGRLLLARGQARLVRGSPSALADLERAAKLGAAPKSDDLARAREAIGLARVRHVDAKRRAAGRSVLAELAGTFGHDAELVGAKPTASPLEKARYGVWAWRNGARREAYDMLAAWHAATPAPRDAVLQQAYLRALGWWSPMWLGETKPPSADELVGAEGCRFDCNPKDAWGDADARAAAMAAPVDERTRDSELAAVYAVIGLRVALRGGGAWVRNVAARVDLAHVPLDDVPAPQQALVARLAGKPRRAKSDAELAKAGDVERLSAAALRALAGASPDAVRAALGDDAGDEGVALLAIVTPPPAFTGDDAWATGVARFARARASGLVGENPADGALMRAAGVPDEAALLAIARAFRRDPAIAERLGRDLVAGAVDAALAHAAVGAVFDALGDPARARTEWQAASEGSDDWRFVAGYAEAAARTGDGDAALVAATTAAAASGDPAVVWTPLAHTLYDVHRGVDALTAARSAIDLAGPDVLPSALDVAIDASRLLGRDVQADALAAKRAKLAPPISLARAADPWKWKAPGDDPTDADEARTDLARLATAATVARAWVASRWNPRDVAIRAALLAAIDSDDPRHGSLVTELVALAGDPDPELSLVAARALR